MISSDPHFKKPELTYNLTDTKYELRMEKLEAGKIYYVGVSLVDDGKYVSSRAGPIPLESPVPPKDMIGKYEKSIEDLLFRLDSNFCNTLYFLLQNVFLISVTQRWHKASVACKNPSFKS